MAATLTFSADLWDGFDRVYNRLTEGRHDMKKMEAYLKQRAKIEEVYAKSLAEASKQTGFAVKHSLAQCWTDIHSSGSSIAKQHLQWSIMCNEIGQKLGSMVSTVKDFKTKLQNNHTALLKDKEAKQSKHTKGKEAYTASVAAAETAITNYKNGQTSLPEKKIAKLKAQVQKAVKDMEKCNTTYTEAVLSLRTTEETFDTKVAEMLQQFEVQEMARTVLLKEQVERYVQAQDFYKNAIEQIGTFSQKGVDAVALEQDIQDFVETAKTGCTLPKYTVYKAIENAVVFEYGGGKGSVVGSPTSSPTMSVSTASVSGVASIVSPTTSPASSPAAAQTPASPSAAAPGAEYATALYDFVSNEADDLPFVAGDVVTLISCPEGEEWWQGTLNGASGMFPTTYVEKMAAPAAAVSVAAPAAAPVVPETAPGGPTPTPEPAAEAAAEPTQVLGGQTPQLLDAKCTSLYQFAGEDTDELSFQAGEELQITGQIDDWYLGKSAAGAVGIFPANYVSRHDS